MADGIGGLFGLGIGGDRESILQQIMKERQARNVAATQNLGKYAGLAQSGMATAQQMNDQVGKMFGIEDPRLQKQTRIQDAAEAVRQRGVDTKDAAATYQAFYEELAKRGLYGEATAILPKLQEAQASAKKAGLEERRVAAEEARLKKRNLQQVTGYTAEDGGPLSFDPETGDYYKGNEKYTGKLIPKPSSSNPFAQFATPRTPNAGGKKTIKQYNPKTGKIEEVEVAE